MNYPKIGIRPVIDGRWGGIREGLEEQTMKMAKAAAELISSQLRYPDGTPAQCVISSTTIGGTAESGLCAEQFATENVCGTLTVTPCWCYGSETMDIDPLTVKAVWGFNGTERPGAVYLASVMAAHAHRGLPAFAIYGHDVQDRDDASVPADVREKLLRFARCALAAGWMRSKAYLNIGSVCMGISGSFCDPLLFQKTFGMRAEWIDMTEILRRIHLEIYDKEEYERAMAWVKQNCREGFDKNAGKDLPEIIRRSKVVPPEEDWAFIVKMYLAIRDLMRGNEKLADIGWHEEALGKNAAVAGLQGQRAWTDWLPNGDFAEALLSTTFDWNGRRQPLPFATENDTLNGVMMLVLNLLTGAAPVFSDVRTYWSPEAVQRVSGKKPGGVLQNGFIHLINSGASALDATGAAKGADGKGCMKPWWEMTDDDISACLDATDWCRGDYEYFRGGGFSSHFKTAAEMPVTMVRLNLIDGLGPMLQIAEGWTGTLDDDIHQMLEQRTDPTWPTTWFTPRLTGKGAFTDVYSVMANWGANHSVWSYGHFGADLITFCSMLRIPVAMHNVEGPLYRPHSWAAFGAEDPTGADYRACEAYGPLYK